MDLNVQQRGFSRGRRHPHGGRCHLTRDRSRSEPRSAPSGPCPGSRDGGRYINRLVFRHKSFLVVHRDERRAFDNDPVLRAVEIAGEPKRGAWLDHGPLDLEPIPYGERLEPSSGSVILRELFRDPRALFCRGLQG